MTLLASPAFLFWLLAAALPLLLWWLFRRRRAVVQWSANYILRRTLQASAMRNLWKQVVILALRVAVLALLVLALAQPFVKDESPNAELPHGDGSLHQVVLVDTSASMATGYGAYTREQEMASRLEQLLRRMRHGDTCEVIPLTPGDDGKLHAVRVTCPPSDADLAAMRKALRLDDRPAAILDGIQLATERFHVTNSHNRHLILLGDLSRRDFTNNSYLDILHKELARMDVRVAAYEIRDTPRPNVAVQSLQVGAGALFAGWQYHVYVDVRNFGDTPIETTLQIEVLQDGRRLADAQVALDLGVNEQRLVDHPLRLPDAKGLVTIRARVKDESFQPDNVREFNVEIRPQARLLVVTNPAEPEILRPLWRDSWYLDAALKTLTAGTGAEGAGGSSGPAMRGGAFVRDPTTGKLVQKSAADLASEETGADHVPSVSLSVTRVAATALTAEQIAAADAVVFVDVDTVEPELRAALETLTRRGGGVLFGMGEHVGEDAFNASFGGFAPARLIRRQESSQRERPDWDYDAPYAGIEKTFDHPLLRHFLDEREGPIENVRVYNYFRVADGGRPLMALSNGDPLLLARQLGRGQVWLYTSSLGGTWNTLAVRNMYVNLVYAWLTALTSGDALPRNLSVGEPLILPADHEAVYVAGDALPEAAGPLAKKQVGDRAWYRFDGLTAPGEYRLLDGTVEFGRVRVQQTTPESDARPLTDAERGPLEARLGGPILRSWLEMAAALHAEELRGWSAVGVFALIGLVLLCLDAVLTRKWFR